MCFLACSLRSSCNSVLCCLSRSCLPVRTLKEVRFLRVAVFCVCVCVTAKHCMMRPCSVKIECLSYSICGPSSSATHVISSTHKNADPFELGKLQRLSNVSLPCARAVLARRLGTPLRKRALQLIEENMTSQPSTW